jgi:hypothetical protein
MSREMSPANDVVQGYLSDFPSIISLFDGKLIYTFRYLPNSQKIFFQFVLNYTTKYGFLKWKRKTD